MSDRDRDRDCAGPAGCLSLHTAAQLLPAASVHDAEVELAQAIEQGHLAASVKRWASEQWQGRQLPGNIDRHETWIERGDFDGWLAGRRL